MIYRPSESLKAVATELAALMAARSTDEKRKETLLHQLREQALKQPIPPVTDRPNEDEAVGIWNKTFRHSRPVYARDITKRADWVLWADVREISPKNEKKRVVLLGESVARGAFYDPCYTVAQELDSILAGIEGLNNIEVTDLAKTGVFFPELLQLVKSSKVLDPDVVVIFAGNNLVFSLNKGDRDYKNLFEIYRRSSFPGVKAYFENQLQEMLRHFMQEIKTLFTSRGIPVVFVIPEYNLKDWKSNEEEQVLPRLSGNNAELWLQAKATAQQALQQHDMDKATIAAQEMITIDPSNPLGYELLGACYVRTEQWAEARASFESGRDTSFMSRCESKPRSFTIFQQIVTTEAADYGIRVVDLPVIFKQVHGALPGRELFLDYCHLTVQGIKTAMRYTAQAVAEIITGKVLEIEAVKESAIQPAKEVEAVAHFCAAIHNAHYGQPHEIVQYHCEKAVSCSAIVKELMQKYIDFSTRHASTLFCRTFEELVIEGETQQSRGIFSLVHPRSNKLMDIMLVDGMAKITGHVTEVAINQLRIQEHGIGNERKNLLESFYSAAFYSSHASTNNSMLCRSVDRDFYFIANKTGLAFTLVYRTPQNTLKDQPVSIYINNRHCLVTEAPASSTWKRITFLVNDDCINEGVNKIIIRWPNAGNPDSLENQVIRSTYFNAMFPVLGEIGALTVTVASDAYRPSVSLKDTASELAALIVAKSPEIQKKESLLQQLQQETHSRAKKIKPATARHNPEETIGIWKKTVKNGRVVYARDVTQSGEWPLWANVYEWQPKSNKQRIVLLGESVARGYFYDPHYNPAIELEAILKNYKKDQPIEVIDLARTSLDIEGLRRLVNSCRMLEPDVVVIFAGNNWQNTDTVLSQDEIVQLSDIYKCSSFPGVKSFFENRLKEMTQQLLQEVQTALTSQGIPVVFVIPEFNLRDWRSNEAEQILPWLPENTGHAWLSAKETAQSALLQKDVAQATAAAQKMTALDPSNPLGYELLGDCYILMERWDEARTSFELGRDTTLMNRTNSKPRCYKILQQTIAAEAADYGITVVNLPVIFKQVYGMVPDRALFLDYCHLTVQGIKTAMRYTAHAILEHLEGKTIPIEAIPESAKAPGKDIEAVAHFCAAIHNAHNGQAFDMVRYHCDKAIPGSAMVKGLMEKFIDFSTRHASTLLCRSFEELLIEQEMRQYEGGLGLANPPGQKLMDVELVDLMAGLLGEAISKEINTLRMQEHGLGSEKKNLLESFYSTTYYKAMVRNRYPNFLQAKTNETAFQFIADKKALAFDLVYRTPNRYYPDMSVKVYLNNKQQLLAELPMSAQWTKCVFMVRDEWVQPGLNTLVISWPYTGEPFPAEPCTSIFSFINGVFPSLGEIIAINAMIYEKENILIETKNSLLTADAIFNELL